uniref:HNH endonuclease n=1 Tax=viral metagenome TaxID=1070528 RepID=A0A6M3XHW9_9ZZZZ
MTAEYDTYLESEEWKALRTRIFEQANGRCVLCNRPANNLHHRTYERVGKELDGDVTALCRDCHALFHEFYKTGHRHHNPQAQAMPQPKKIPEYVDTHPKKAIKVSTSKAHVVKASPKISHKEKCTSNGFFVNAALSKAKQKDRRPTCVFARLLLQSPKWDKLRAELLNHDYSFREARDCILYYLDTSLTPSQEGALSALWGYAHLKEVAARTPSAP